MDYRFETTRSRDLAERLRRVMPGGDTRSGTFYPLYPLALARGAGYRVWDVDGNEFIDLVNNYTSLVHGHAAPAIVEAIVAQAPLGTAFPAPGELQAELAERICQRFASIERVRFTNSGTEANMQAVRAARASTGREEIVKADGGYHGSWEQVPWQQEHEQMHAAAREGVDDVHRAEGDRYAAAIPKAVRDLVHMVDFNDPEGLEATMKRHGEKVAAILLEPVLGRGLIAGSPDFFAAARDLADAYGALLICDEVITARLHTGGYQAVLGVRPDLTTLGKIIGGGLPVGAVGGRPDVIDLFDPRRPNFLSHAGTFNGNCMTMAAGCASLDLLPQAEIDRINGLGASLADKLRHTFAACGLAAVVTACGSLLQVDFGANGETSSAPDAAVASALLAHFHFAALEEGVYLAPRGFMNVSTAMNEAVIGEIVDSLVPAAQRVAESTGVLI